MIQLHLWGFLFLNIRVVDVLWVMVSSWRKLGWILDKHGKRRKSTFMRKCTGLKVSEDEHGVQRFWKVQWELQFFYFSFSFFWCFRNRSICVWAVAQGVEAFGSNWAEIKEITDTKWKNETADRLQNNRNIRRGSKKKEERQWNSSELAQNQNQIICSDIFKTSSGKELGNIKQYKSLCNFLC